MTLWDAKYDSIEYYDINTDHEELCEIIKKNISFLRLYLSYLDSKKIKYNVICRPEQRFYIICSMHNCCDTSLTIAEQDKIFCCYGCGRGGGIVDFVLNAYGLNYEKIDVVLKILMSFINNNKEKLSVEERKIYDDLFGTYCSKEKSIYFKESELKTKFLKNRITKYCNYLEKCGKQIDYKQIANRLSCNVGYVKKIILKMK